MEKVAYVLLALLALVAGTWLLFVVLGKVASFLFGLIGLAAIVGIGLLFVKVLLKRLRNK